MFQYSNQKNPEDEKNVSLDPNHSYFLLVDDGSYSEFGVEIALRAELENEIRKGYRPEHYLNRRVDLEERDSKKPESIPMILIVLQGGPNTLKTIHESLSKKNPVLLIEVRLEI